MGICLLLHAGTALLRGLPSKAPTHRVTGETPRIHFFNLKFGDKRVEDTRWQCEPGTRTPHWLPEIQETLTNTVSGGLPFWIQVNE